MLFGVFEDVVTRTRPPRRVTVGPMNLGPLPMGNGLTRLQTRFLGDPDALAAVEKAAGEPLEADEAERNSAWSPSPPTTSTGTKRCGSRSRSARRFSPDALTGLEANYRFAGPETMETKIFGRLTPGRTGFSTGPTPRVPTARCAPTARASGPISTGSESDRP